MTLTVAQVVDAARDLHPAFTVQRAPNPMSWRLLKRRYRELLSRVAQIRPSVLSATVQTVAVAGVDHDAGIAVSGAVLMPLDCEVSRPGDLWEPVELVNYANRFGQVRMPAASLQGQTLWLLGGSANWQAFVSLRFRYIPEITTWSDGTVLALPDQAEDALVAWLAAAWAARMGADPDVKAHQMILLAEARSVADRFYDRIAMQALAESDRIQDVSA